MYKFNYLLTINREKEFESQRKRVVNLVFILSLVVSFLFIGLLYINSSGLYTRNENFLQKENDLKEKLKKFRNKKEFFTHNKILNIYNAQNNRVIWTDVFYYMETLLGEKAIIEEVHYNFDRLVVAYKLKAEDSKTKGDIMRLLNDYKDSLSTSRILKKYLAQDVDLSDGPNKGEATKIKDLQAFFWTFEFVMEFKPLLRFTGKGKSKKNRKSRFN